MFENVLVFMTKGSCTLAVGFFQTVSLLCRNGMRELPDAKARSPRQITCQSGNVFAGYTAATDPTVARFDECVDSEYV
jgi:hypothetical protein